MNDSPSADQAEALIWEPTPQTVPDTWQLVDFGEAFESVSVNQKKLPAKAYKAVGLLPVVDQGRAFIGGYTDDESLTIDAGEGVIVFGDHTRVFKRVTFPFAAGADGIKVLRPRLSGSKYAHYACMALQFPNRGYSRHYSFLAKCKLPIAPEKEQERIVSKIDELFSRIEEGERTLELVQKLVERYRQSVLRAAVTDELTRDWREKTKGKIEPGEALLARILKARRETWEKAELDKMKAKGIIPANDTWKQRYEEPALPDTADLPELPEGWTWASMDQLSSKITSGSRDWKHYYGRGDSVFVMAQNVRPGRLDLTELQLVDPPLGDRDAERSEVFQHDLLVTIVGANTGDVCRVSKPLVRHYVCQSVALVRPVLTSVAPFLELFLCADEGGQTQFAKVIYGAGRPHLSFDQLRAIAIPLPPIDEQIAASNTVELVESEIQVATNGLATSATSAAALRQAVLRSAFSGELLAHDPTDEPASALLDRIAAEYKTAPASLKRGSKNKP